METSARVAADAILTNSIAQLNLDVPTDAALARVEEKKLSDRIIVEIQTRGDSVYGEFVAREAADVALGVRCDGLVMSVAALSASVGVDVKRLDERVNFITINVTPESLDSLTEIVNSFNASGATYASRLNFLEGIVQSLVNHHIKVLVWKIAIF